MSISAVGSGGAHEYLRSLLQQQSSAKGAKKDRTAQLMDAFYPNGTSATSGAASASTGMTTGTTSGSSAGAAPFSSETFGSILSLQGQQSATDPVTARAQAVFKQLDANGDGSVAEQFQKTVWLQCRYDQGQWAVFRA